jgi:gluconolactonase
VSHATSLPAHRPASAAFVTHDPSFAAVLGASPQLARVAAVDAHEGPVYAPDEHALYFTTVPRATAGGGPPTVAIKRLDLDDGRISVLRPDANVANGMALGLDGHLVVCEQGTGARPAALTRVDRFTGRVATIVDAHGGRRLNSPNDVAVRSDGTLWFTDPSYGFLQGFRPEPQAGDHVLRYDPRSGRLSVVAASFDKPNGIAFSPDERVLYVADSGANHEPGSYDPERPHHVKAFDVVDGRRLANERLFAVVEPGFPDGLKVDSAGRVYASSASGVQVFDAGGRRIGEIALPGAVNFTFGGRDRSVLYITADDAIWAAGLAATTPPRPKGA